MFSCTDKTAVVSTVSGVSAEILFSDEAMIADEVSTVRIPETTVDVETVVVNTIVVAAAEVVVPEADSIIVVAAVSLDELLSALLSSLLHPVRNTENKISIKTFLFNVIFFL